MMGLIFNQWVVRFADILLPCEYWVNLHQVLCSVFLQKFLVTFNDTACHYYGGIVNPHKVSKLFFEQQWGIQ